MAKRTLGASQNGADLVFYAIDGSGNKIPFLTSSGVAAANAVAAFNQPVSLFQWSNATRPTANGTTLGYIGYNTDTAKFEGNADGATWAEIGKSSTVVQTPTAPTGTTLTIDWAAGNVARVDLSSATGAVTLTLQNPVAGTVYTIETTQGGTVRQFVFPGTVLYPNGGTGITLVGKDVIKLFWDGTNYYVSAVTGFIESLLPILTGLGTTYGWWFHAGGIQNIDKLNLSAETISNFSNGGNNNGAYPSLVQSQIKALGQFQGQMQRIDIYTFSSDTIAGYANDLGYQRNGATGVSSPTYGYFFGNTSAITNVDRANLSTNSIISTGVAFAGRIKPSGGQTLTIGYLMGGDSGGLTATNTIQKVTFSSDTYANTSATLREERMQPGSIQSRNKLYTVAGRTTGNYTPTYGIDAFTFSGETQSNVSTSISQIGRYLEGGVNKEARGYIGGVELGETTRIDYLTFSGETTGTLGVSLNVGKSGGSGACI